MNGQDMKQNMSAMYSFTTAILWEVCKSNTRPQWNEVWYYFPSLAFFKKPNFKIDHDLKYNLVKMTDCMTEMHCYVTYDLRKPNLLFWNTVKVKTYFCFMEAMTTVCLTKIPTCKTRNSRKCEAILGSTKIKSDLWLVMLSCQVAEQSHSTAKARKLAARTWYVVAR